MPKLTPPEKPAELNLCLQWGAIPGGEMKAKLDFLEANGFGAVEIPSDDWPKYASYVILLGLVWHFLAKLMRFLGSATRRESLPEMS